MHNDKLGIGQYLRSVPLMMLLPFASVLVLLVSGVCITVMFILFSQAVVAMRMRSKKLFSVRCITVQ